MYNVKLVVINSSFSKLKCMCYSILFWNKSDWLLHL